NSVTMRLQLSLFLGLAVQSVSAVEPCSSDVLVRAFKGLDVNKELYECMSENNFNAALSGKVDLASVKRGSTPEEIRKLCSSDACVKVVTTIIASENFQMCDCTVGEGTVIKNELLSLKDACDGPAKVPTQSPSVRPTTMPTPTPGLPPPSTIGPYTPPPTSKPTPPPTTTAPTDTPSNQPTAAPAPGPKPSSAPTNAPSSQPTVAPAPVSQWVLMTVTPEQRLAMDFRRKVEECAQQSDAARAVEVYAEMKAAGVQPTVYIQRCVINICAQAEDVASVKDQAFAVYDDMQKSASVDESTFSALIKICSKAQDFATCHTVFERLEERSVNPKLRTFSPMLAAYSETGALDKCLWVQAKAKEHGIGLAEPDFVHLLRVCVQTQNAEAFYNILDEFVDTILQPGPDAWEVLKAWFQSEAAREDGKGWRCEVGTVSTEGICSITGDQLQSLELSDEQTEALLAKIQDLVRTDEKRTSQWQEFVAWLDAQERFDVVLDAANIGYFNQNFDGGCFTYTQIERVLQHYQTQGKKVLVVLHKRRTSDDQVPPSFRATIKQWAEAGIMFNCLPGNNDDWYWLYAAVKLRGRTLVVSNDQMRDHHFQMIHNKAFVRWKERHQVHYEITDHRLKLHEPAVYSARPQRVGRNWHFPAPDGSSQWLCCQLETN
ncbi:TPA: hypothetical protein N0F65_012541, partial [Lagenidium giganteum]